MLFPIPTFKLVAYAHEEVNSNDLLLISSVWYLVDPTRPFFFQFSPGETVYSTVPLDAVAERCIERCSRDFSAMIAFVS